LQVGALDLDTDRREVRIQDGFPITLTDLENRLLEYMMLHAGHILTIQDLINYIWGPGGADRDMLRQLVRRLRVKIEPDPSQPRFIETVPGKGYGLTLIPPLEEE
jgi:DNA-binding response OmpR family regulator